MTAIQSASDVACAALRLSPIGMPYEGEACHCTYCAKRILRGDIATIFDPARTFTDTLQTALSAGMICGSCAAVTQSQQVLRNFQRCVITLDGVYPIGSDENRSWLWLTPPEPPFVIVINHNILAAFHFVWRTPVTWSKKLMAANVDDAILWVNHAVLMEAVDKSHRFAQLLQESLGRKAPASVWAAPSREGYGPGHGALAKTAQALARTNPEAAQIAKFLSGLEPGVLVALASIVKSKPATPVKPDPKTVSA